MDRVVWLSMLACELSSLRESATRAKTPSAALPLLAAPCLARLSMALIRISNEGEIPVVSSRSDVSP